MCPTWQLVIFISFWLKILRMEAVSAYLEENEETFVSRLAEQVAIASISASPEHRNECIRQMHETQKMLHQIQAQTEMVDIGTQKMHDGETRKHFKFFILKFADVDIIQWFFCLWCTHLKIIF